MDSQVMFKDTKIFVAISANLAISSELDPKNKVYFRLCGDRDTPHGCFQR